MRRCTPGPGDITPGCGHRCNIAHFWLHPSVMPAVVRGGVKLLFNNPMWKVVDRIIYVAQWRKKNYSIIKYNINVFAVQTYLYHTIPVTCPISTWRPICITVALIMSHDPHHSATVCLLIPRDASIQSRLMYCTYILHVWSQAEEGWLDPPRGQLSPLATTPRFE